MNTVIYEGWGVVVTPWKLVGYLGALTFASRWVVQVIASKIAGRSHLPRVFWHMSLTGSLLLLLYFIFGKNDSVGILSNFFPACIAGYNLFLDTRHRKNAAAAAAAATTKGS
jgi:lipid-A-disaccharide synthase-like uncharacterized protein